MSFAEVGSLSQLRDDTLAARAHSDLNAFAELYRRYLCPVYRFVRSQTPDDSTAEDVTAHVFFKALSSARSFRADSSYRSWLFRIAHNAVLSWRKKKRSALILEQLPESVDPTPTPQAQAVVMEERHLVWRTVAELPPAQREVVALRYLEDLSTEEIATVTNRTQGAVRIMLHRARNRLRRSLQREGVE